MSELLHHLLTLRGRLEWALFVRAVLVSLTVRPILTVGPVRAARFIEPRRGNSAIPLDRHEQLVDLALDCVRPLVRSDCLVRGVTRYRLLRARGVDVNLVFGASAHAGEFVAHCWLEHMDRPYLEVENPRLRFTEIYRWPSSLKSPVRIAAH